MQNNPPKVSVLMLTYNQEQYIDEAIRSVMIQQTNFSFELVIGNDCSTDGTAARCKAWQARYPHRIHLIDRPKNLGLAQNFMQTYAECKGKYVAICEGDDYWCAADKLQVQVDFLNAHPDYSCCFHRVVNYYEDRGTKSLSNGGQKTNTNIIDLARGNYISNVSAVFRRNLFGPLPDWFAQVSTYDYALHLLNAQYGKLHYMHRPMAVYRQHGRAIWSEAGMDKKLDIALVIRELLMNYFRPIRTDVYDALRTAHSNLCLNLIGYYQRTHNEEGVTQTEQRLLNYRPELTINDVRQLEWQRSHPSASTRLRRLLKQGISACRGLVSRVVPLPRIKGE